MKILITGSSGQLGRELLNQLANCKDINNHEIITTTRKELNLRDERLCEKFILDNSPDLIINLAAYTAVEEAETNIEDAFKINSLAVKAFAKAIKSQGGFIIHISTDYVFDGKNKVAYSTNSKRNPINVYGKSKLEGEKHLENLLKRDQYTIIRTSWLIGKHGNNFLNKMLNKMNSKNDSIILKIVSDQKGCITTTKSLSNLIINLIKKKSFRDAIPTHLHWSSRGKTNWYEVAKSIKKFGNELNLIQSRIQIVPINSIQFDKICPRPKYSLLDISETERLLKIESQFWELELKNLLIELKGNQNLYSEK